MTLVQFGAGNIGRSFIGQLFARAGWDVCFVDVDRAVVQALNERREYVIQIQDDPPDRIVASNVRAVDGRDAESVVRELVEASVAGAAVGAGALAKLYPVLAAGVRKRAEAGKPPLDVILCENLHQAARRVAEGLRAELPAGFPLEEHVGLVETSIGKMVPLMSAEDRARDPLLVYAEAYNTLICDALAFRNGVPAVPGLDPKRNMAAYVDRKLYIHNLGHAVCAYVGNRQKPGVTTIWRIVEDEALREAARAAMWESGGALLRAYPEEFSEESIGEHIEDLLRRFANRALGDTVFRVGRDLRRKLAPEDRLIGALRLDARHGVEAPVTELAVACALRFDAVDESGKPLDSDAELVREAREKGVAWALREVGGLDEARPEDRRMLERCVEAAAWADDRVARGLPLAPDYMASKGR